MSDIEFSCPNCKHSLIVDSAGIGSLVQCPECHNSITIPQTTPLQPPLPPLRPPQSSCPSEVNIEELSYIQRTSWWSGLLIAAGFLFIPIGFFATLLQEDLASGLFTLSVFISAAGMCFLYSFIVSVITEIRWVLALIAKNTNK